MSTVETNAPREEQLRRAQNSGEQAAAAARTDAARGTASAEDEARRQAEAARADEQVRQHGQEIARRHMQFVNQPLKPPMNLGEACARAEDAGEDVVLVAVPRNIMLTLDFPHGKHFLGQHWGTRLVIPEGVQEMPRSLADHWWVAANGVKPYRKPGRGEADPNARLFSEDEMNEALRRARAEATAIANANAARRQSEAALGQPSGIGPDEQPAMEREQPAGTAAQGQPDRLPQHPGSRPSEAAGDANKDPAKSQANARADDNSKSPAGRDDKKK